MHLSAVSRPSTFAFASSGNAGVLGRLWCDGGEVEQELGVAAAGALHAGDDFAAVVGKTVTGGGVRKQLAEKSRKRLARGPGDAACGLERADNLREIRDRRADDGGLTKGDGLDGVGAEEIAEAAADDHEISKGIGSAEFADGVEEEAGCAAGCGLFGAAAAAAGAEGLRGFV